MNRLPTLRLAMAIGTVILAAGLSAFAQTNTVPPTNTVPLVAAQPAPRPTTPANRSYLKIDGVTGESTDAAHPGWFDLTSFQWGIRAGSGAARMAARPGRPAALSSLSITKTVDKSSALLQKASMEGTHFKTVVLEFLSHSKNEHYQITMSDVLVSSLRVNGEGSSRPTESITLNFAKIDFKYGTVDAQNNRAPLQAVPAGWDVRQVSAD